MNLDDDYQSVKLTAEIKTDEVTSVMETLQLDSKKSVNLTDEIKTDEVTSVMETLQLDSNESDQPPKPVKKIDFMAETLVELAQNGDLDKLVEIITDQIESLDLIDYQCYPHKLKDHHLFRFDLLLEEGAKYGHIHFVRYLLEKCTLDTITKNYALEYSAEKGHLDVVKLLISSGADVHYGGNSVLQVASEKEHLDIVEYLVEQGCDINAVNSLPLRLSIQHHHLNVAKFLLDHGANLRVCCDYPLRLTACSGPDEMFAMVLEYAEKTLEPPNLGKAEISELPRHLEIDPRSLNSKEPIDYQDLLILSARFNQLNKMKLLLQRSFIYSFDEPLEISIRAGHSKMSEFLEESKSRMNANQWGSDQTNQTIPVAHGKWGESKRECIDRALREVNQ